MSSQKPKRARALAAVTLTVLATAGLGLASASGEAERPAALPSGTTGPNEPQPGGQPKLSIKSAKVTEGDRGTRTAKLALKLSKPAPEAISVRYKLKPGSAKRNSDFLGKAGTANVKAGAKTGAVPVKVRGDRRREAKRESLTASVKVVKSAKSEGAKVKRGSAKLTIVDDD